MTKTAVIEYKEGRRFVRCPDCNSWDRALSNETKGKYTCEECGTVFEIGPE